MSFFFRDAPVVELFEMLSRKKRVNIMLSPGVTGKVTVNLYDISLCQAIYAIAEAAGYTVEERAGGYLIQDRKDGTRRAPAGGMEIRSLRVQYSNPRLVAEILGKYSSRDGRVTLLEERKLLIAEDAPDILDRIERMLREIDKPPVQSMTEAKILEIALDDSENFGVDWSRIFSADGTDRIGTRGLANRQSDGLFFNLVNSNVGDKIGYRLTTTINNVSTESIQFLETGIILRVTPSVDVNGRIAMKIRPEVSSGSVSGGIPSKKTTEVTTQLIAEDGQSILIDGLIKSSDGYRRAGVPVLGEVPIIGRAFSNTEKIGLATETIVLITPRIVGYIPDAGSSPTIMKVIETEQEMANKKSGLQLKLETLLSEGEGRK